MNLFAWLAYRKPFIFHDTKKARQLADGKWVDEVTLMTDKSHPCNRFLEDVKDGVIKSVAEIAIQLNYIAAIEEVEYDHSNHYFTIKDGVAVETHEVSIIRYGMPGMSEFNKVYVLGTRTEHCDHIKNIVDQVNKEQYDMQVAAQARAQLAGVLRR